jgi:hypothetical protein
VSERTWSLSWRSLDLPRLQIIAADVAAGYEGVVARVEEEDRGTHTCFFDVPGDPEADDNESQGTHTAELSLYDLGRGELVLSLELDASDNEWLDEEADQLAEDLADALGGEPVYL